MPPSRRLRFRNWAVMAAQAPLESVGWAPGRARCRTAYCELSISMIRRAPGRPGTAGRPGAMRRGRAGRRRPWNTDGSGVAGGLLIRPWRWGRGGEGGGIGIRRPVRARRRIEGRGRVDRLARVLAPGGIVWRAGGALGGLAVHERLNQLGPVLGELVQDLDLVGLAHRVAEIRGHAGRVQHLHVQQPLQYVGVHHPQGPSRTGCERRFRSCRPAPRTGRWRRGCADRHRHMRSGTLWQGARREASLHCKRCR